MAGEKTEKPTGKKLRDTRRKGQPTTPVTPELGSWAAILVASVVLPKAVSLGGQKMQVLFEQVVQVIRDPQVATGLIIFREAATAIVAVAAPLMVATMGASLLTRAAQGGMRPNTATWKPRFNRLNPLSGVKRMVGGQAIWQLGKVLFKTIVVAWVVWKALEQVIPLLATGGRLPISATVSTVGQTLLLMLRNAAAVGLAFAVADYAMTRRRLNKSLKMSKQDIKDEHKQSEGDPLVKSQIRSRQMAMSRNRMMSAVKEADVVVVNPIHLAVALRYDPAKGAPRVVAKGAGIIAAKIRAQADEHRVPLVENVALARLLYKSCKLGQEIPAETYAAVAQVLAFVLALKARGAAAGFHRPPAMSVP